MGWRVFAIHDGGFDFLEAGAFQEIGDLDFSESEVGVGVEFVGLVEGVLEKIKNDEAPARLEDAVGFAKGLFGIGRVVKRLTEKSEVD